MHFLKRRQPSSTVSHILAQSEPRKSAIERIADILEGAYDPEKKAFRLYDTERAKVYRDHLAPDYREKFGMK